MAFVDNFIELENSKQAAKAAGYSGSDNYLAVKGSQLRNHTHLKAIIDMKLAQKAGQKDLAGRITRNYLLDRWQDLAEECRAKGKHQITAIALQEIGTLSGLYKELPNSQMAEEGKPTMSLEERNQWLSLQSSRLSALHKAGTALANDRPATEPADKLIISNDNTTMQHKPLVSAQELIMYDSDSKNTLQHKQVIDLIDDAVDPVQPLGEKQGGGRGGTGWGEKL